MMTDKQKRTEIRDAKMNPHALKFTLSETNELMDIDDEDEFDKRLGEMLYEKFQQEQEEKQQNKQ